MKARSIKGTSPEEIQTALELSLVDGFTPTLAIVFISIKQDSAAICSILNEAGIAVFGASTNGEFIDEDTMTGGIAILLFSLTNFLKRTTKKLPVKLPENLWNILATRLS